MQDIKVWDPLVRIFHWSLVLAFGANALIVDEDSKLHETLGWAVVSLVLFRLVWGMVGPRYARFKSFPPSVSGVVEQATDIATGRRRLHIGHTPMGALMIYNLLLSLLFVGCSGWLMTTDMFWGVEWPEVLHELSVAWTEVSVVAHVIAVVYESHRTRVNLPRAMVTGVKRVPTNRSEQETDE